jgi:hypothetical protein
VARVAALTQNLTLKLSALGLSLLLWAVVRSEQPYRLIRHHVPVTVSLRDEDWVLTPPARPHTVSVTIIGPLREILRLNRRALRVVVPVEAVVDTVQVVALRAAWVDLPAGNGRTRVADLEPGTIRLHFSRSFTGRRSRP